MIWVLMAIGLVILVASGFVGRSRVARQKAEAVHTGEHHVTHHGKGARRSRGRGRKH